MAGGTTTASDDVTRGLPRTDEMQGGLCIRLRHVADAQTSPVINTWQAKKRGIWASFGLADDGLCFEPNFWAFSLGFGFKISLQK